MDAEQTLLHVHFRLAGLLSRILHPQLRTALQWSSLVTAVSLVALVVLLHFTVVGQVRAHAGISSDCRRHSRQNVFVMFAFATRSSRGSSSIPEVNLWCPCVFCRLQDACASEFLAVHEFGEADVVRVQVLKSMARWLHSGGCWNRLKGE